MKLVLLTVFICCFNMAQAQASDEVTMERKQRVENIFNELRKDNLEILDNFYHPELHFLDPIGEMKGLKKMKAYYAEMYENVKAIKFDFETILRMGQTIWPPGP